MKEKQNPLMKTIKPVKLLQLRRCWKLNEKLTTIFRNSFQFKMVLEYFSIISKTCFIFIDRYEKAFVLSFGQSLKLNFIDSYFGLDFRKLHSNLSKYDVRSRANYLRYSIARRKLKRSRYSCRREDKSPDFRNCVPQLII